MKKLIIIPLFLIAFFSNAQFKFGVGGGVNFARQTGIVLENKELLGYNIGLISEIKLPSKLGFEADALLSLKGASFHNPYGVDTVVNKKLNYIDFPVVAKLYMVRVINLQFGPQFSYLLSANSNGESIKYGMKPLEISAVVGFGIDVKKFHASCRYNFGLTSTVEGADVKNKMLTLTVGLWLKK